MKMMACVVREGGLPQPFAESKPISVEEVTLDGPGPGEVLVKVGGAGLCHSDLSILNGDRKRGLPMVIGHEGAGEIVELGAGVDDLKVGDHVVFQFSASCGRCRRCLEGRPQICERAAASKAKGQLMSGAHRLRDADGNTLNHHSGVSCFAEYNVLDRGSVVVVDPTLPFKEAAIFGCAVMTGAGAVINTANVQPGNSVAIFGVGGVGLSAVVGAKKAGANPIIAVDLDDAKLEFAKGFGATHVINASKEDPVAAIHGLTAGKGETIFRGPVSGADFAFDCIGIKTTMEQIVPACRSAHFGANDGGTAVLVGVPTTNVELNAIDMLVNEKHFIGSIGGSCSPDRDFPTFLDWEAKGDLRLNDLVTARYSIDQINQATDDLEAGRISGRAILEF